MGTLAQGPSPRAQRCAGLSLSGSAGRRAHGDPRAWRGEGTPAFPQAEGDAGEIGRARRVWRRAASTVPWAFQVL